MRRSWIAVVVLGIIVAGAAAVWFLLDRVLAVQPVVFRGVVLVRNKDVDKQVPISGVQISVGGGNAEQTAWTNSAGYFSLTLKPPLSLQAPLILRYRALQYYPLDRTVLPGARLTVVWLEPLVVTNLAPALPLISVTNVTIHYSVSTRTLLNVGSLVKTFHVVNTGNVPCQGGHPCSPDGKWKAAIGSASMEAPSGNVFENARVSCIAGPCPFTTISFDGFSRGGPLLRVSVLDWSDTTTFLFEAEVFRTMIGGSARVSYPVIFGPTLHFTIPALAEEVYIQADIDNSPIVFPLGPNPILSWADCSTTVNANSTAAYLCTLKPGYTY